MRRPTLTSVPSVGTCEPLAKRSDDELMLLSAAGREDAFEQLVQRHMRQLLGYCSKQVCDPRLGEEISQETWLRVWSYRARYQPQGKFRVLLYTTARNRCRNHARNAIRRSRWFSDLLAPAETTDTNSAGQLDTLLDNERATRIHDAMMMIGSKFREVLLLRFDQDMDYEEIAEIVGRAESTVRSRVFHGLKKIRKLMKEDAP